LSHYYRTAQLNIVSDVELPSLPSIPPESKIDVRIEKADFDSSEPVEWAQNLTRLGIQPHFALLKNGHYFDWIEHGKYQILEGNLINYDAKAGSSAHLEHFIINEVFASIFFQRGAYLLHGSAALNPDGTATVVFGEPGAGKSTTLGMLVKYGAKVLSDEIVVIQFIEGKPFLYPFVPLLRLWGESARYLGYEQSNPETKYEFPVHPLEEAFPLKNAISLKPGDQFEVKNGADHSFHLDLFGNFPLPRTVLTPVEQMRRFQTSADLIRLCKCYKVQRNSSSFEPMDEWINELLRS
jgi:hypothetical protein